MFQQRTHSSTAFDITSPGNQLLKDVRRAVDRGALTSDGLCVAETFHLLEEAFRSECEIVSVLVSESASSKADAIVRGRVPLIRVPDKVLASVSATETTQGIIALVRPPVWEEEALFRGQPLIVVLDGVQDPGNAGAILRAAEAFGASGALFLKGTVNAWNPKTLRGSAGSIFRVPLITGLEPARAISMLGGRGAVLYSAMPRADTALWESDLRRGCAVVIGSEGRGAGPEMTAVSAGITIPTTGVESLNAAVAAAVVLYEASRQRLR